MTQLNWHRGIAFISSFLRRRCGIANFISDLIKYAYRALERVFKPVIVAIQSDASQQLYGLVECVIRKDIGSDHMDAADIYITPCLNKEQLTSGTPAFAVGRGKTVVSNQYWVAEELLANGRGVLVPFGDAQRMAEVINKLLNDESLLHHMKQRAYNYSRAMTWSKAGQAYWNIFGALSPFLHTSVHPQHSMQVSMESIDYSLQKSSNASDIADSLEAACL